MAMRTSSRELGVRGAQVLATLSSVNTSGLCMPCLYVVIYDNIESLMAETRKNAAGIVDQASPEEFKTFPEEAQSVCLAALTIAAEGGKADIAKPMLGLPGTQTRPVSSPVRGSR